MHSRDDQPDWTFREAVVAYLRDFVRVVEKKNKNNFITELLQLLQLPTKLSS